MLWGDATDFFVGADEVAGIGEAGFLADVVESFVGVEKKVVGFADSYKFNVFLAGAAKVSFELLSKVGVTHSAFAGKIFYTDIFCRMGVYIFKYRKVFCRELIKGGF